MIVRVPEPVGDVEPVERRGRADGEEGAAVAEFAMVAALLTVLFLSVLQLGLALLVRNTVLDAASEGARYASLADRTPADGVIRTRELIGAAIGSRYAEDVRAGYGDVGGVRIVTVAVRAPLPVFGLVGVPRALDVVGHAAVETIR